MASHMRSRVLTCFKSIHRTRQRVFKGDVNALTAARQKINEEFKKHKAVSDEDQINELIGTANEANECLRLVVVQAKFNEKKDVYEVNIRGETKLLENAPFYKPYEGEVHKKRRKPKSATSPCEPNSTKMTDS